MWTHFRGFRATYAISSLSMCNYGQNRCKNLKINFTKLLSTILNSTIPNPYTTHITIFIGTKLLCWKCKISIIYANIMHNAKAFEVINIRHLNMQFNSIISMENGFKYMYAYSISCMIMTMMMIVIEASLDRGWCKYCEQILLSCLISK